MRFTFELRLGLRSLARTPGFFFLASLTLALGIGIAALMFSVTESVLWRPLPLPDPERLVLLLEFNPKTHPADASASAANFLDWRVQSRSFERVAAFSWSGQSHTLTGTGERVRSLAISSGAFETLGVRPALGRTFGYQEEGGSARTAILSHEFWRTHFDASPAAVGRTFQLDRQPYTVAGVLPSGFQLEAILGIAGPDLFVPLDFTKAAGRRGDRELAAVARLRPQIGLAAARAEMGPLSRRLAAAYPNEDAGWSVHVENLRQAVAGYYRTVLYLFFGFAVLVLVIACANVAGLELVRAVGRQREYALRMALGARRTALLRHALAEAAWLAVPGGAAGALLAAWAIEGLRAALPPGLLGRSDGISMDFRALAFVAAVSLAVTFLVAMVPALLARAHRLDAALREGPKSVAAAPGTQRLLNSMIAAEVALSFVLLFSAGLFVGTNSRLREVKLGFDPAGTLLMRITAGGQVQDAAHRRVFYREVLDRATGFGGVWQAALASAPPLSGGEWLQYTVNGRGRPARGEEPQSLVRAVTPGFFGLLRIPLLAGRAFTDLDSETAPRVAIVNENLARSAFPGENPVGKVLDLMPGNPSVPAGPVEIVGLAANTRELGLDEVPFEDIYLPFAQNPQRTVSLIAKVAGPAGAIAAGLRIDLQKLDPDSALYNVRTFEEDIAAQFRGERFRMILVSLFAALAALLAAVGSYSVLAFSVAQRRREFALRIALGAMPAAIRRISLVRTARVALTGAGVGLAAALVLGALLGSTLYLVPHQHTGLLYGVKIADPATLFTCAALLLAVALASSLLPAMRAAKVDPAAELRHE